MSALRWIIAFSCALLDGAAVFCPAQTTNQPQTTQTQAIHRVGADEFATLLDKPGLILLDVRTPGEFASGHIKSALNLDFHGADFETSLSKLDKSKTYLVYCAGGARSSLTCKKMSHLGFSKLVDLAPGFAGWKQAKKPVEK